MFSIRNDSERKYYLLIVLGHHGHPEFKTIHLSKSYLQLLGEGLVDNPKSSYSKFLVLHTADIFNMTSHHYSFDEALIHIVREMLLKGSKF